MSYGGFRGNMPYFEGPRNGYAGDMPFVRRNNHFGNMPFERGSEHFGNMSYFETTYPHFRGGRMMVPQPYVHDMFQHSDFPDGSSSRGLGPERNNRFKQQRFNPNYSNKSGYLQKAERARNKLIDYGVKEAELMELPPILLIKFHATLCDLCDYAIDNATIAKMHYNSKAHARNVQKWLMERTSVLETSSNKQIQIDGVEARHVKCELCDVLFTSKSHMDAHYSGKNHWAVVDGRKKPKNPILLSEENEDLLKLLQEREKPYMSNFTPTSKTAAKEKSEALAIIDPKLHCDICNISASNEEQLVVHKNGKKHLSKERSKILEFCTDY